MIWKTSKTTGGPAISHTLTILLVTSLITLIPMDLRGRYNGAFGLLLAILNSPIFNHTYDNHDYTILHISILHLATFSTHDESVS